MFFSSNIFTLIRGNRTRSCPCFMTFSIGKISFPLSFISISNSFVRESSYSLGLFLKQVSLVIPSLRADESSLSTRHTFYESTSIATSIGIIESSSSMRNSVFPFAVRSIDHSSIIDGICLWIFFSSWELRVKFGLKLFKFFFDFDDIAMRFGYGINWCKIFNELILVINALIGNFLRFLEGIVGG